MSEKSCLITSSLLGSVKWFLTAPDVIIKPEKGGDGITTWKEKAEKDLKNLLSRKRDEFPIEAQQGVKFEKKVYQLANNLSKIPDNYSEHFKTVCKEVHGFEFFKKGGVNLEVNGNNCYLYGKYDAYSPFMIKDIKTTKEYKENKYLNTAQHLIYCYISKIDDFEYIIAEWEEFPKIRNVYKEVFHVEDKEKLEKNVIEIVSNCLNVLKDYQLWDLYKEKFCLY